MSQNERLIQYLMNAELETEKATKNIANRFENKIFKYISELEDITVRIGEIREEIEKLLT